MLYVTIITGYISLIQDGFFDGELLDGRRGLVPSNYVQQLYGRDLEDFYQSMVVRLRECDDSATTTVPQNIEYMLPGEQIIIYNKNCSKIKCTYIFLILIDEQMKRLAQQEYNNMLEELQEDDNVDDDGEILKIIYLYN